MSEEEYYEFSQEELSSVREGITDEIFEIKNFCIQKVPVLKLFEKRIERVEELAQIQKDLFPEEVISPLEGIDLMPFATNNLRQLFNTYFSNKHKLKQRLFGSQSLTEIAQMMRLMCENEKQFAHTFNDVGLEQGQIVSKELNPMDIIASVDEAEKNDIYTLDDVKNKLSKLPFILNGEIKRLLLLNNKF